MSIAVPFISHFEQKISVEQAMKIAEILGLPAEISFISLTIDEELTLRAFARGISKNQPFHFNSVPMNWLAYTPPTPPPPAAPEPVTQATRNCSVCGKVLNDSLRDGTIGSTLVEGEFCSVECACIAEERAIKETMEQFAPATDPLVITPDALPGIAETQPIAEIDDETMLSVIMNES